MLITTLTLCISLPIITGAKLELPKWAKRCSESDDKLDECLRDAMQTSYAKLSAGYPPLGIPVYEPLVLEELDIQQGGEKSNVRLNMNFKNLSIIGLSALKFRRIRTNFKELILAGESVTEKLLIESNYNSNGRILVLNLSGSGRCNITMDDMDIFFNLTFKPTVKGKETYWPIQEYKIKFKPKKVHYYFSNLISSKDKALNAGLNDFMNQNWEIIFNEMGPAFEEAFEKIYRNVANRVFSRIPINQILLP